MRIAKTTYSEIINATENALSEEGGIIGGNKDIVYNFFQDKGIDSNRRCCYTPNVSLLNAVIDKWNLQEIYFMGLYHIHFNDVKSLSGGDVKYINEIMLSMPLEVDKVYFPLVVLPSKKMICYSAKKEDAVVIKSEPLIIV